MTIELRGYQRRLQYLNGTVHNLMDYLFVMDKLTTQHHYCGQVYERWQMIFRKRSGYGINPLYSGEVIGGSSFDGLDSSNFMELIRKLSHHCDHIEHAIYTAPDEYHRFKAFHHNQTYIKAFDKLEEILLFMKERDESAKNVLEEAHDFR